MEDKLRIELQQASMEDVVSGDNTSNDKKDDFEFYETIEAPKFVDFTRPNHYRPDDRYWFCSRLGCNQNHEDSEAIYKDFVLRVMAARSPNIRCRRALDRRPLSENKKCPFSAPPKSSKSKLPRLAVVSSVAKKLIVDENRETIPSPAKPASTPKTRVKQVPAKYMTSPRKKKGGSPNMKAFRSVRNPLKTSITLQKKVVAKALMFSSPKKSAKVKALETATPITRLCEGVKKLAINSEKKINTRKITKGTLSVKKLIPTDTSKKQPRACKGKPRLDYLSSPKPLTEKSAKGSTCVKVKAKQVDKKHDGGELHEKMSEDEPTDMEIDVKSRTGSTDLCSATLKAEVDEKHDENSRNTSSSTSHNEPSSSSERPVTAGSRISASKSALVPDPEDRGLGQQNVLANVEQTEDQDKENKPYDIVDDLENQNLGAVGAKLEDNEDKENAVNSNQIRNLNVADLSKQDRPVKCKVKTMLKLQNGDKSVKDNGLACMTQGVKYKKLKPTNPKPFRLRTDERGILKEATLEKKAHSHESSANMSENSQCIDNTGREKVSTEAQDRTVKKVKFIPVKSRYRETSKEAEQKSDKNTAPCTEKQTQRTKSQTLQKLIRPKSETGSRLKYRQQNGADKSVPTSKVTESKQQQKEIAAVRQNVGAYRKKPTVPREPNFHTSRKPKSCTTNIR